MSFLLNFLLDHFILKHSFDFRLFHPSLFDFLSYMSCAHSEIKAVARIESIVSVDCTYPCNLVVDDYP